MLQLALTLAATCAAFGGEWVGTCSTDGGAPRPARLAIEQIGCERFSWNSLPPTVVGETVNERWDEHNFVGYDTRNYDWSADRSRLHTTELLSDRVTGDERFGSWVTSQLRTSEFRLDAGRLVLTRKIVQAKVDNGVASQLTADILCRYDRQP